MLKDDDVNNRNIDGLIQEYIDLVKDSDNHLDFSLSTLAKMIIKIPFLEDGNRYDELFELLTTKLAERKQETTRGNLLVSRAIKLAKDKPISAISYLGRALIDLYKEESKNELILALAYIASCLERIGCLWAARNYNLHVFALCFTQYIKYGEIHPALVASSNSLKMLELQLGRISYALSSHKWSIISENLYKAEVSEHKLNEKPTDLFEPILAIAILKIPFEKMNKAGFLVNILKKQNLYIAEVALKYMLGYYDEDWLEYYEHSISNFEKSMEQLYFQPASEQILYPPWLGIEENVIMRTRVLGCNIIIEADNKFVCLELGATILTLFESFFATGMQKRIVVRQDIIKIRIQYSYNEKFVTLVDEDKMSPDITIECSDYDKDNIVDGQDAVSTFLQELFPKIVAQMVYFGISKDALDELIMEERAFDRSFSFSNSIFFPAQVLGDDYGVAVYSEEPISQQEAIQYPLIRTSPVRFIIDPSEEASSNDNKKLQVVFEPPPDFEPEKISHQQMRIDSIIELPLWDNAIWRGVGVVASPENEFAPFLGLLFENNSYAQKIFRNWRNKFGIYDADDEIQIGIIKGIDKKNPCYYRVIITSNLKCDDNHNHLQIVQWNSRLHTMEAQTLNNLLMFEDAIKKNNHFSLSLFTVKDGYPEPLDGTAIKKNIQSVTIRNAWEIEDGSYLLTGVIPTDDPIIPLGAENAPIIKVIEYIRRRFSDKIGRNAPCPCGSGKKYKNCCLSK